MKIYWKTRFAQCLLQTQEGIHVYQNFKYRWLTFENTTIQTLINRRQPQRWALNYLKPFTLSLRHYPGETCLLGLGGGAVVHAANPYLNHSTVTVVELNRQVIHIAQQYFMLEQIKNLAIVHQDANIFVKTSQKCYQHLLIDVYNTHDLPDFCHKIDFFIACRQSLSSTGFLCINIVGLQCAFDILQLLRQVFGPNILTMPVRDTANLVMIASAFHAISDWSMRLLKAREIKRLIWDEQWGYIAQS